MLRPGLAGVHGRQFPGQWWECWSLGGFAPNRLAAEAEVDSRVVHVMDPAGRPQVLIGHKPDQVPGTPSECSNNATLTMEWNVAVMRTLFETFCSPRKDVPHSGLVPQREFQNPNAGIPTQVSGETWVLFVPILGSAMSECEAPGNADLVGLSRAAAAAAKAAARLRPWSTSQAIYSADRSFTGRHCQRPSILPNVLIDSEIN